MAGWRDNSELNDRERLFVAEYLVDMNASQAATRAGYSPKTVGSNSYRVMRRPRVKAAIAAAMAARERDLQIDAREVLDEIARLAFANLADYLAPDGDGGVALDLSGLTRDKAAGVATLAVGRAAGNCPNCGAALREGLKFRLRLADKARGLALLGRHLGLFAPGAAARLAEAAGGAGCPEDGDGEAEAAAFCRRIIEAARRHAAGGE